MTTFDGVKATGGLQGAQGDVQETQRVLLDAGFLSKTTSQPTGIKLPSNSTIVDVTVFVEKADAASNLRLGHSNNDDEFVNDFALGTTDNVNIKVFDTAANISGNAASLFDVGQDTGNSDDKRGGDPFVDLYAKASAAQSANSDIKVWLTVTTFKQNTVDAPKEVD